MLSKIKKKKKTFTFVSCNDTWFSSLSWLKLMHLFLIRLAFRQYFLHFKILHKKHNYKVPTCSDSFQDIYFAYQTTIENLTWTVYISLVDTAFIFHSNCNEILFEILCGSACLVRTKVWMSAFTIIQMNCTTVQSHKRSF